MSDSKVQNAAIDAVNHILRRCQTDPDFAWHMMGTESFSLCCLAAAEYASRDASELRASIEANVATMQKAQKSEIEQLRVELQLLQDAADENKETVTSIVNENLRSLSEPLHAIRDLVNFCRLRGEPPTLEALEAAIEGKSLALCLGKLA
mgnify:CR=1 FL=1